MIPMPRGGVRKLYIFKVDQVGHETFNLKVRSFLKDEAEFAFITEGLRGCTGETDSLSGDWESKSFLLATGDLAQFKKNAVARGARFE